MGKTEKMDKEKRRHIAKRLYSYIFRYKKILFSGLACMLLSTVLNQSVPLILKFFLDDAIDKKNVSLLGMLSLICIGVFLVKGIFVYFRTFLISMVGQLVVMDLRNEVYRRLQHMSLSFFDKRRTGELMSRVTNDVGVVQSFVSAGVVDLVTIPIGLLTGFSVIVYLSAKLTLISLVAMPLIAVIIGAAGRRMKKVSALVQVRIAELSAILQETLSSIRVVQSFTMEEHEIRRFAEVNRQSFNATMRSMRIRATLTPFVELLGAAGLAMVFWTGGHDIIVGTKDFITGRVMTKGDLIAFLVSLQLLYTQFNRINETYLTLQQSYAAAERLFQIVDAQSEVVEKTDAGEMPPIDGKVEFENVAFAYNEGEPILSDIHLTVEPGRAIALVGSSGAGKTTFVNLIPRFYDITAGTIRIDGIDIRESSLKSLRLQMGIVPQESVLFSASIEENISYGKPGATTEEIEEAARAANAHDFIAGLPNGYKTVVGERGVTLSGGQRQRVAIARAILKNPRILILDEATSSVDSASEAAIQEALEKLMRNRTTFIIAHRLSTIQNADLILVLDRGRIVERGRHQELYDSGGVYRHLYDITLLGDSAKNDSSGETADG